jgi:putative glutamine amidotransferase
MAPTIVAVHSLADHDPKQGGIRMVHSGAPVIGISAHTGPIRVAVFDMPATFVARVFVDRVAAAGCAPVLLPPLPGTEHVVERLDGLLMLAGPDVDPARYGAARRPQVVRVDPARDEVELALLGAALRTGVPVLGVCRGMQLLNVLHGGTLHQHLPEILGHDRHLPAVDGYGQQPVRVAAGSRLAEILGAERAVVPCHHHQAVDRLGTGLRATAWSEDGVVEAVEVPDHPFAVGAQWHAERSDDDSVFLALAEAARRGPGAAPARGNSAY